jgi:eukaryotic-like serine/threonine-protein kinase
MPSCRLIPRRQIKVIPSISPQLAAIIQKALAKDRLDRYQQAAQLRDLSAFRLREGPSGIGASPVTLPASASTPTARAGGLAARPPASGRNPWLAAVAAAFIVILATLAVPSVRHELASHFHRETTRASSPPLPNPISVAVLPATAVGGDPHLTALGNGLVATVTALLVQFSANRTFEVIPASEIEANHVTTLEHPREVFGVSLGLEFDLQSAGNLLRVSYTLVDSRSGRALRADSITVPKSDLLALEDRVVESAAAALGIGIRPEEQRSLLSEGTGDPSAYDYYLQGLGYLQQAFTPDKVESAATVFDQALKLDPQFGLAEARLGETYFHKCSITHDRKWIDTARDACGRAIHMGNAGGEGHVCLGQLALTTGDYAGAA